MSELDLELRRKLKNAFVAVELPEHDAPEARIRNQLKAAKARRRRHIDVAGLEPNAVPGGLDDSVGLSMHRSHAVTLLHEVALVIAVPEAANGTVVARGLNGLIAHDDGTDMLAITRGAGGDLARNSHEILVPSGASACHVGRPFQVWPIARSSFRDESLDLGRGAWLLSLRIVRVQFATATFLLIASVALCGQAAALPQKQQTEALLAKLAKDPEATLATEYRQRAQQALDRAQAATLRNQPSLAAQLEALARRWAMAASDLLRAARLERRATEAEKQLELAQKKALRARALIEEMLAQKNRALGKLQEAEALERKALGPKGKP